MSVIFPHGWKPLKNISIKNAVSVYYNAKDKYFCNQLRKTFLFIVSNSSLVAYPLHLTWKQFLLETPQKKRPLEAIHHPLWNCFLLECPRPCQNLYCPFWEGVWIISRTTQCWSMVGYFWQKAFVIQCNLFKVILLQLFLYTDGFIVNCFFIVWIVLCDFR